MARLREFKPGRSFSWAYLVADDSDPIGAIQAASQVRDESGNKVADLVVEITPIDEKSVAVIATMSAEKTQGWPFGTTLYTDLFVALADGTAPYTKTNAFYSRRPETRTWE